MAVWWCMANALPAATSGLFTYTSNGTSVHITGYPTQEAGGIVIPATIANKPVTGIGNGAFSNCSKLTGVAIPASVTSIGMDAFNMCTSLAEVTIPAGVTSIGDRAFYSCASLTGVTIPAGVTRIGIDVFNLCTGLTEVTIPAGVTSIGDQAFCYCYRLAGVTLPAGVTSIGISAFNSCNSLTDVTIPAGVTRISARTFYNCPRLVGVSLPAGITGIGEGAFQSCTSLAGVAIPASVTTIDPGAFRSCTALVGITLPAGITSIGENAFNTCSSLTEVVLPPGITRIPDNLFDSCASLVSVTIPAGVTTIGSGAFQYCAKLAGITLPAGVTIIGNSAFKFCGGLTRMILPAGVTAIGDGAFCFCANLTSVTIPASVTRIGSSAFQECPGLTDVTIPAAVTRIENGTFYQCTGLTSVIIPAGVTAIARGAFEGCGLTRVTIPARVTDIASGAFARCASLAAFAVDPLNSVYASVDGILYNKSRTTLILCPQGKPGNLVIPAGVTSIGIDSFLSCGRLENVTIPDSVTSIGSYAFCGSGLTGITIGAGVTTIGSGAFYLCPNLTDVTIPDNVTSMGDYVFYFCGNLRNATIGSGVIRIGYEAFYYCTNLTSVTIGTGVAIIESAAFGSCQRLTRVTIPPRVTTIGSSAFNSCTSLANVTIGAGVTTIGDCAFYSCRALASVRFAGNAPAMGNSVFYDAASELTVYYFNGKSGFSTPVWYGRPAIGSGTCVLTTAGLVNGTIAGIADHPVYPTGTTVMLTAVPAAGFVFAGWTGSATGTVNPLPLLLDADLTIGASFAPDAGDGDGDGLSNYDEVFIYGSDPHLADTDGDGFSDTYELCYVGTAVHPRVGDPVAIDLGKLTAPGNTLKLSGRLPAGLTFNATTGRITGTITGAAGTYAFGVQVLQRKSVLRTIPFAITVADFPAALIGNFEGILENDGLVPVGACRIAIPKVNTWSATLEMAGAAKRTAKGTFFLRQGVPVAPITASFPATATAPAVTLNVEIDGSTPLISGNYHGGSLRGFRLTSGAENPPANLPCTLVMDAGVQDGIDVPAGLGWAKGTINRQGSGSMSGQLGDGTAAAITLHLSATGQAVLWAQPYANRDSYIGGIITLAVPGRSPVSALKLADRVWWYKAADARTPSYPDGFPGMEISVGMSTWIAPSTASALGASLGWENNRSCAVKIDGAGLTNHAPQATTAALPTGFTIHDSFSLVATAPDTPPMLPWSGKVNRADGSFSGAFTIPAGFAAGIPAGSAGVSGVLVQDAPWAAVTGCGLIKVPTAGSKGSFRTAAFILEQ